VLDSSYLPGIIPTASKDQLFPGFLPGNFNSVKFSPILSFKNGFKIDAIKGWISDFW